MMPNVRNLRRRDLWNKMYNGIHSHFCNTHKADYECAKVTHCRQDYHVSKCPDCIVEEMEKEKDNGNSTQSTNLS
jgi:hypothetical protein